MGAFKAPGFVKGNGQGTVTGAHLQYLILTFVFTGNKVQHLFAVAPALAFRSCGDVLDLQDAATLVSDNADRFYTAVLQGKHGAPGQVTVDHALLLISQQKQIQEALLILFYLCYFHKIVFAVWRIPLKSHFISFPGVSLSLSKQLVSTLFVVDLFPEIHLADNEVLVLFQLLPEAFGDVFQHQVEHRLAVLEIGDPCLILAGLGKKTQLFFVCKKVFGEIDSEGIRGVYAFDGLHVDAKDPDIGKFRPPCLILLEAYIHGDALIGKGKPGSR